MPGWRMLALMLTPTVMAIVLVLLLRGKGLEEGQHRVRGVWLVFAAFVVRIGVHAVRSRSDVNESGINRTGAAVALVLIVYFLWVNRAQARSTVIGAWLIACGAGMNAVATVLFGAMPALGSAARIAGYDVGDAGHPWPGYVLSDRMNPVARYLGDFIPIPGQMKVLSIGDVMLIAGLVVVFVQAYRIAARPPIVPTTGA